jgi:hypothetical protein
MARLAVALEMRQHAQTRRHALGYLLGRYPLAKWEEDVLLAPRLMCEPGPTEVSGVRGETECPSAHWDQVGKPCYVCKASI